MNIEPLSVIVVGAPRSGTYWVVDLLQTRLGIHIPSETHFFPLFARYIRLWGDLSRDDNRRRLLRNIYEFVQAWTARSSVSADYLKEIRRLSLLVTLDEGHAPAIVAESHDYPSLVEALYRHFAQIHGADASGDKSAHHRVIDPDRIFSPFPEARMLHVVRDGRDVALSWMKEWFGPPSITDAARKWREHVRVNRAWGRLHPERYHEIRYEDLAFDRPGEIRRLEAFLGRPDRGDDAREARSDLARALSKSPSHAGMTNIDASSNTAKWKRQMSPEDLRVFETVAGDTLEACGYETASPIRGGASDRLPAFSPHSLRLAGKKVLPFFLVIAAHLHLPLLAVMNRRYPPEWRRVEI